MGSTTPGGIVHRPTSASIAGNLICPNPDLSVDKPIVITLRYSTSGSPHEHSPTLRETYHCPFHSGPFDIRKRPWGQSVFLYNGAGAGATVGRRLHVWIEVTFGGAPLASIRVRMTPKGKGAETLVPDGGACATRCARSWTKHRRT